MVVNLVFSDEDKILIKKLHQLKGYKATELMNEFPNKWWTKSSIIRLLTVKRRWRSQHTGSSKPRNAARTEENVDPFYDLVLSQIQIDSRRLTERCVKSHARQTFG